MEVVMKFAYLSLLSIILCLGCMPGTVSSDNLSSRADQSQSPKDTETTRGLGDITPTTAPEDNDGISWDQAVSLILEGKVKQVVQFHDLTVILVLEDETMIETAQPQLDDVFSVIDLCGEKCAEITLVTE
jgi:hypothetical protein